MRRFDFESGGGTVFGDVEVISLVSEQCIKFSESHPQVSPQRTEVRAVNDLSPVGLRASRDWVWWLPGHRASLQYRFDGEPESLSRSMQGDFVPEPSAKRHWVTVRQGIIEADKAASHYWQHVRDAAASGLIALEVSPFPKGLSPIVIPAGEFCAVIDDNGIVIEVLQSGVVQATT